MSDKQQDIQTRETLVCGKLLTVFSCDGERWFTDRLEALQWQKKRDRFFAARARSLMNSSTFQHESRPIGKRAWNSSKKL